MSDRTIDILYRSLNGENETKFTLRRREDVTFMAQNGVPVFRAALQRDGSIVMQQLAPTLVLDEETMHWAARGGSA